MGYKPAPYSFMGQLYLAHHGVDGMKWGERNGPPYPLIRQGRAKFSKILKKRKIEAANNKKKLQKLKEEQPEEYEAKKQKTLKGGSAKQVLDFQGDLTNQQLQDAVNRLNLEMRLKEISDSQKKKGINLAKKISDSAKLTGDVAKAGKAMAEMASAMKKLSKEESEKDDKDTKKKSKPEPEAKTSKKDDEPIDGEWRNVEDEFDPRKWVTPVETKRLTG